MPNVSTFVNKDGTTTEIQTQQVSFSGFTIRRGSFLRGNEMEIVDDFCVSQNVDSELDEFTLL